MTREEAKEFAPILQAYAEGEVIECRTDPSVLKKKDTPNNWTEMKEIEFWNNVEYRIKPEPTYRPFMNDEECWQEMLKHQPFGWTRDTFNIRDCITRVTNSGIVYDVDMMSFEDVFNKVKFADGATFGIKVE